MCDLILDELHRQEVGCSSKRCEKATNAGSPCDRQNERRPESTAPQILDAEVARHCDPDRNHGCRHNGAWQESAKTCADEIPDQDLTCGTCADTEQRRKGDSLVETPAVPGRGQNTGGDEQNDQFV